MTGSWSSARLLQVVLIGCSALSLACIEPIQAIETAAPSTDNANTLTFQPGPYAVRITLYFIGP